MNKLEVIELDKLKRGYECPDCGRILKEGPRKGADLQLSCSDPDCGYTCIARDYDHEVKECYRQICKEMYGYRDNDFDVDDDAVVSLGCDAGAYVQIWAWITDECLRDAGLLEDEDDDDE